MNHEDEIIDGLNITLENTLDLEERLDNPIHLVGRLIADHKPSQKVIKEIIRSAWNKMRWIQIIRAKENIYAIMVDKEAVARRFLEGNPWFVKDYTFTVKFWPSFHSFDDIEADREHGLSKIGVILEVEDPLKSGFHGFLRLRVDFNARKSLLINFSVPCPVSGSYTIRLKYESLQIFCYWCGRLGHFSGYHSPSALLPFSVSRYSESLMANLSSRTNSLLFKPRTA
ncbi:hypothetical protein DVH24_033689 [Malus domestica]|uniref:DUF4283 domain-containing protein n=1 Tax=Malus domestica TaxID=3750 RepID=A0A498HSM5_MALDO|nr:hypothetical protein DVH24_033689 [Malus domestica]